VYLDLEDSDASKREFDDMTREQQEIHVKTVGAQQKSYAYMRFGPYQASSIGAIVDVGVLRTDQ
jgi:hypothetical protein